MMIMIPLLVDANDHTCITRIAFRMNAALMLMLMIPIAVDEYDPSCIRTRLHFEPRFDKKQKMTFEGPFLVINHNNWLNHNNNI
jgi:hypothetical protein